MAQTTEGQTTTDECAVMAQTTKTDYQCAVTAQTTLTLSLSLCVLWGFEGIPPRRHRCLSLSRIPGYRLVIQLLLTYAVSFREQS